MIKLSNKFKVCSFGVGVLSTLFMQSLQVHGDFTTNTGDGTVFVNMPYSQMIAMQYFDKVLTNVVNPTILSLESSTTTSTFTIDTTVNGTFVTPIIHEVGDCTILSSINKVSCDNNFYANSNGSINFSINEPVTVTTKSYTSYMYPLYGIKFSNYSAPTAYDATKFRIRLTTEDFYIVYGSVGLMYNGYVDVFRDNGTSQRINRVGTRFAQDNILHTSNENPIIFKTFVIPAYSGNYILGFNLPSGTGTIYPLYMGYLSGMSYDIASLAGVTPYDSSLLEQLVSQGTKSSADNSSISNNASKVSSASSKVSSMENIENRNMSSLNSNLSSINVNSNITGNGSFIKTAKYVGNIFDHLTVNTPIGDYITYTLILGLSLAMIGRIRR